MQKTQKMQMSVFVQNLKKKETEILTFYGITVESIKVQKCSAPQNDRLNLSFVKDNHVGGKKWPGMVVTWPFISIFHFRSDYRCPKNDWKSS